MKNTIYRYTVYVGDVAVKKTDSYQEALEHKSWLKMKLPKAPVRINN
jgi:hypothetical protein